MGLLDELSVNEKDRDSAFNTGLLSMGLSMLQKGGKPMQALGSGGLQGMQAYQQAMEQAQAEKIQQFKIQQMQAQLLKQKQQEEFKAKIINDPSVPEHIRNGIAAGVIDLGDLMKPQTVKEGEQLINPFLTMTGGNGVIAEGPKPRSKPPAIRNRIVGNDEIQEQYNEADGSWTELGRGPRWNPRPLVNVDNKVISAGETAQASAYGKELGELRSTLTRNAFTAPSKLAQLDRMEQLLTGVDGGKLAPLGADIASAARSIGLNIDPKLANKEAAEALSREIASSFRQAGTGPMTDKDFENFLKRVPDLSKTAEGRKQILSTMRTALKRDIEVGNMVRNYAKSRNGNIDDGFIDELSGFYAKSPVVGNDSDTPPAGAVRRVR